MTLAAVKLRIVKDNMVSGVLKKKWQLIHKYI